MLFVYAKAGFGPHAALAELVRAAKQDGRWQQDFTEAPRGLTSYQTSVDPQLSLKFTNETASSRPRD
ncbi:hypothetical protein RRG08_064134 [Elysia crispata]|uniref:Uncharacterized protein n=1 Tax=Elysia crispata TaxID=231223 RepID=A0AAE0ZMD5_9GAST|nr:hypothetical protein RRG08_064134 [Elysia crispata]